MNNDIWENTGKLVILFDFMLIYTEYFWYITKQRHIINVNSSEITSMAILKLNIGHIHL